MREEFLAAMREATPDSIRRRWRPRRGAIKRRKNERKRRHNNKSMGGNDD